MLLFNERKSESYAKRAKSVWFLQLKNILHNNTGKYDTLRTIKIRNVRSGTLIKFRS